MSNYIAEYFKRSEFSCKCGCGLDTVDAELLKILGDLREEHGPITITSGHRCAAYNEEIGGYPQSQHLHGRAVDFVVKNVPALEISARLRAEFPDSYGIGAYQTFTHLDTRTGRARWEDVPREVEG